MLISSPPGITNQSFQGKIRIKVIFYYINITEAVSRLKDAEKLIQNSTINIPTNHFFLRFVVFLELLTRTTDLLF